MEPLKTLADLKVYANWIGKTPVDVLELAKFFKWSQVFPGSIHASFSRVRQYFNLNPTSLTLLNETKSRDCIVKAAKAFPAATAKISGLVNLHSAQTRASAIGILEHVGAAHFGLELSRPVPILDDSATLMALSGAVYKDQNGSEWFQTTPGGTVYHWKTLLPAKLAAAAAEKNGQALVPVFKLVCPDGTGGSRECIIFNKKFGTTIGAVDEKVIVAKKDIETNSVLQGSYNYAETIEVGYSLHNSLDVKSDRCIPDFLIKPRNYELNLLSERRFSEIKRLR